MSVSQQTKDRLIKKKKNNNNNNKDHIAPAQKGIQKQKQGKETQSAYFHLQRIGTNKAAIKMQKRTSCMYMPLDDLHVAAALEEHNIRKKK